MNLEKKLSKFISEWRKEGKWYTISQQEPHQTTLHIRLIRLERRGTVEC